MNQALVHRLVTSLIAAPLALAILFYTPISGLLLLIFITTLVAVWEFVRLARVYAPHAPLRGLFILYPAAVGVGIWALHGSGAAADPGPFLLAVLGLILCLAACLPVLAGTPVREGLTAVSILAFATPYFAVPVLGIYWLRTLDPWLVVALFAIVWLGDTAAFFIGSAIGRHKLAPVISPGKTWEGASASFLTALLAAGTWSVLRLGELRLDVLAVAALTGIAAQLGDLVESMIKRGAGAKDSSRAFPGHGGFYDRLDALLLATPIFVAGLWFIGVDSLLPGR